MPPTRNLIKGCLTSASILAHLSDPVFIASRVLPDDEYQLGWRTLVPESPLGLSFNNLEFATSEGINALAMLCDVLDFGKKTGAIEFNFDKQSRALAEVMDFSTVSDKRKPVGLKPLRPCLSDSYSTGSCVLELADPDSAHWLAQEIIESSAEVIAQISNDPIQEFRASIERVATEALLNVYEHAYWGTTQPRRVFACATIFRGKELLASVDDLSDAETNWLEHYKENYVFELAISDTGLGIPRTLWQDAKRRQPQLFEKLAKLSSATKLYKQVRAEIQADLCLDAFHHESTGKRSDNFRDVYHGLNWRGLYRGRQPVASYQGFIALSSGRGRAGYASIGDETLEFVQSLGLGSDLPGTTLSIRLPLPLDRSSSLRRPRPIEREEREKAVVLKPSFLEWRELELKNGPDLFRFALDIREKFERLPSHSFFHFYSVVRTTSQYRNQQP